MTNRSLKLEDLIAYAAGELSPERTAEVERAIAADPDLVQSVESYRLIIETMRTDDSIPAPPEAIDRAKALFNEKPQAARPGVLESLLDAVDRLVATLLYDSRAEPALAGFRGTETMTRLSFECGETLIDLEFSESDAGSTGPVCVLGQVSTERDDCSGHAALVRAGSKQVADDGPIEQSGMFQLDVPPGAYDLVLQTPAGTVAIERLEIGA